MNRTARRSRGASNRIASTVPSIAAPTTNPPSSAAAALSGWPSISVARRSRSGLGQRLAEQRVAGDEPGHRRRRRRAEPARERDLVAHLDPPADALAASRRGPRAGRPRCPGRSGSRGPRSARPRPRPRPSSSISPRLQPRTSTSTRFVSPSATAEAVVARAEVGARRRHLDGHPAAVELGQPVRHHPSATATEPHASARASMTAPAPAGASAVAGSLRPLPVRTQTTSASARNRRRAAATFVTPATLVADDGSQKIPSSRGEAPVRGEDLVVRHRLDQAAALVAGRDRLRPGRGVADPDRRRDRVRAARPAGRGRAARRRRPGSRTSAAASRRCPAAAYSQKPAQ